MRIAVLNITYQTKPTVEPLGVEQAICALEESGFETFFWASSLSGEADDVLYDNVMQCEGVLFAGINNVRDILDQFYTKRDLIATELRKRNYKGFIAVTGHQASLCPEETLNECTALDAVIIGDSDAAAFTLARMLSEGSDIKGFIRSHPFEGFDASVENASLWEKQGFVSIASRRPYLEELLKYHSPNKLAAVIETSRGCSHGRCTFCSTAALSQAKCRISSALKPIDDVVDEMRYLYDRYDIKRFIMEDDFAASPNHAGELRLAELARQISVLPFKAEYSIVIRPDAITDRTRDIFEELRESGLVLLYLGIESFNEEDLVLYNKKIELSDLLRGVDIAQELGYKMGVSSRYRIKPGLMPFHPYTKLEGIKRQSPYLVKYAITPVKMIAEVELFPGTELYEKARKDGLLAPGKRSGFNYEDLYVELFHGHMRRALKAMHKPRKRIRNIEKTVQGFSLDQTLVTEIVQCRVLVEALFERAYDEILDCCLGEPIPILIEELANSHIEAIEQYISSESVKGAIDSAWESVASAIKTYYPNINSNTEVSISRPCWFPVIH